MPVSAGVFTCVLDTSFINGQLSWCLTSSTISCSQVDSSWTPWLLPEDRRPEEAEAEAEAEGVTGLDGLGGGAAPGRRRQRQKQLKETFGYWLPPDWPIPAAALLRDSV